MEAIVIGILIFVGIIVIIAVVFGGWVIVAVLRLLGRGVGALTRRSSKRALPPAGLVRCVHPKCSADSPKGARFCRRCGRIMQAEFSSPGAGAERPVVRRVAMW